MKKRSVLRTLCSLALTTLALTASARAQPANDNCAAATAVVDGDNPFDNRGATKEISCPCARGGFSGAEVWYSYIAPVTGVRNFTIKDAYRNNGSPFDSQVSIYDACGGTLLACDDDSGVSNWSKIYHFQVTQGTTYIIRIGNWATSVSLARQGYGILSIAPPPAPVAYEDCELATQVSGQPLSVPFTTVGLTDSDTQGWDCEPFLHDGWFVWTPSQSGVAVVNACNAEGVANANQLQLAIYTACGQPPLLCNSSFQDPPAAFCQTKSCFEVLAGQSYVVRLGHLFSTNSATGTLEFEVRPPNTGIMIPAGAIAEPGTCADVGTADANFGCNVTPNAFTTVQLCQTRSGTASAHLAPAYSSLYGAVVPVIDEDWYAFTLDSDQSISITGQSEFPPTARIAVGCPETAIGQMSPPTLNCLGTYAINYTSPLLIAGTYYFVISPQDNGRSESTCGTGEQYWFKITGAAPCPPTSENCCRGTTCNSIAAGTCTGTVAGSASITVASCGSGAGLASCCYADFNHDGTQSIDDLFLYFNAYFTGSPWANYGGDGVESPTIDDLFLYINAYFTGCS